ncbi:MAG: hypothetical protein EBR82_03325 [Caulobacteraceae bacterium]|nr:hypothetical protein [Caulobacteraceae bacterium]
MRKALLQTILLAVALVYGAPEVARACSYAGNTYDRDKREPLDALFRRSAFVERVLVQIGAPPTCPRRPSVGAKDDVWDAYYASAGEQCAPDPFNEPPAPLTGIVEERFKGSGPDTLSLAPEYGDFSDVRRFSIADEQQFADGERARASGGHAWPEFWLESDIGFAKDGTNSCGGRPFLVPAMDYVLFRDQAGKIVGAEPVSRDDDAFLGWLRRDPAEAASARTFTAQQAFAATPFMALVEVTRCPPTSARSSGHVAARLLQGDPTFVFASEVEIGGEAETYYLDAWFAFHRTRCHPMTLLVVSTSAYPASARSSDETRFQGRAWVPPTPAVVAGDSVRVADLFPGVHLTGPERVTVDQAFAWQEAGKPAAQVIDSAGPTP